MSKNYQNNDKDIFDGAEILGNLVVKAHKTGGMPLVLLVVGIIFIVLFFGSVVIKLAIAWSIVLLFLAISSFAVGIYLYKTQEKISCPKCGKELVVRVNKKTKERFWGCSTWPRCMYTKDLN